jgi:alkanesulfonate monooxygenase SsuD/methylene tetrahydromethanopterin reductase-like flavin-dependent oxidoreductase (luciferase family)
MRIGAILPLADSDAGGTATWDNVLRFATHAEGLGFETLWAFDHFLSETEDGELEGVLEAWTVVSALAATTSRCEIGQMVMCASFRDPGMLAKMAVTADDVSGGRITLGLGAGWFDREYRAFGLPTAHRVDRFEEQLQIILPLLRGQTVTFAGRYHQADDAVLLPSPSRRVPVLIASRGPRMLRLTARHADAWNTAWFGLPDNRFHQRLHAVRDVMDVEGRDPATLRMTVGMEILDPDNLGPEHHPGIGFTGSVDELARAFDVYDELGFDDIVALCLPMTERSLDLVMEAWRLRTG